MAKSKKITQILHDLIDEMYQAAADGSILEISLKHQSEPHNREADDRIVKKLESLTIPDWVKIDVTQDYYFPPLRQMGGVQTKFHIRAKKRC